MTATPTVALTMIAKDEAHIIERCLELTKGFVDHVVLHDTGSSDDTAELAMAWCERNNVPCFIRRVEWQDFAHNRTLLMDELRTLALADYGFMVDVDNLFQCKLSPEEFRASLATDVVEVEVQTGGTSHTVPLIYRASGGYHYRGVLHEFMDTGNATRSRGAGFHLTQQQDSARNQNPKKYLDDAAVLEKALATEQDPNMVARYTFYLAQSYRDAGEIQLAIEAYEGRAALGGWDQEVFYSYLSVGELLLAHREKLEPMLPPGALETQAVESFLLAYNACPYRAESLHALASFHRGKNQWGLAYLYANVGAYLKKPDRPLFINNATYEWAMVDELAIASFYTGQLDRARELNAYLLTNWQRTPFNERARIFSNLQLVNQHIYKNTP